MRAGIPHRNGALFGGSNDGQIPYLPQTLGHFHGGFVPAFQGEDVIQALLQSIMGFLGGERDALMHLFRQGTGIQAVLLVLMEVAQ